MGGGTPPVKLGALTQYSVSYRKGTFYYLFVQSLKEAQTGRMPNLSWVTQHACHIKFGQNLGNKWRL